jgi:hypothetical protein
MLSDARSFSYNVGWSVAYVDLVPGHYANQFWRESCEMIMNVAARSMLDIKLARPKAKAERPLQSLNFEKCLSHLVTSRF